MRKKTLLTASVVLMATLLATGCGNSANDIAAASTDTNVEATVETEPVKEEVPAESEEPQMVTVTLSDESYAHAGHVSGSESFVVQKEEGDTFRLVDTSGNYLSDIEFTDFWIWEMATLHTRQRKQVIYTVLWMQREMS